VNQLIFKCPPAIVWSSREQPVLYASARDKSREVFTDCDGASFGERDAMGLGGAWLAVVFGSREKPVLDASTHDDTWGAFLECD